MYLLDTDTVIYALKGVPAVVRKLEEHGADPKAISVITYGELLYGAAKSTRTAQNLARVRRTAELFPVVDVTRGVAETFSAIKAELEGKGRSGDDFDLLIASTALMLNYKLVTNNERHFAHIRGLAIENWSKG